VLRLCRERREEDVGDAKRHEVEILLKAGHPKAEVARLSGISLRSVKRIAEESPVGHVDDARERAKRQIGRPSTVANFRKQVVEILQETPDLASLEILRRVRESGYQGGKTALYELVASLRPKPVKPLVRFEGLPGETILGKWKWSSAMVLASGSISSLPG
jgi:transposase